MGLTWLQAALVALPVASVYAFVCLSAWYVARGLPLMTTGPSRILAHRPHRRRCCRAPSGSRSPGSGCRSWSRRGWRAGVGARRRLREPDLRLRRAALPAVAAVSYLLVTFEESRAADRRALQVQVLAREAELRSLRAQIDPHFLFNSLHSISALTTVDPPAARRMCLLLAEFLRETLALGARERASRSRASWRWSTAFSRSSGSASATGSTSICRRTPTPSRACVPPLLLQPLVENAVTHGDRAPARRRHDSDRRVDARRRGSRSSSRIRAIPIGRAGTGTGVGVCERARAPARALRRRGDRATAASREASGAWSCHFPRRRSRHERRSMPLRVVIVDDEPLARAVVREYLGRPSGRRDRRRVRQRLRGGQGGDRAGARSAVPRRADAEARRLRGARAARPRRAGRSSSPPTTSTRCARSTCTRSTTCSSRSARSGWRRRCRGRAAGSRAARRGAGEAALDVDALVTAARPRQRAARARAHSRRRAGARPAGRADRLRRGAGRLRRASSTDGQAVPEGSDAGGRRGAARSGAVRAHPPVVSAQHRADRAGRAVREGQPDRDPARRHASCR